MTFKLDKPLPASCSPLTLGLAVAPSVPSSSKQISYEGTLCEFLTEPPQKFICSICTQLAKDPHLTACCGHEFCEVCLNEWKKKSVKYSCPHCRESQFVHILDKQTRREIEELKVYCPKRSHGCTWQGELGEMKSHERDCSFTPIKCPQCSTFIPQKDLQKHTTTECALRESKCSYCGLEDAHFKVISFMHMAECPGYPMDCPNKCGAKGIKRSNLLEHRKGCPLEEVECPLKSAGCLERMPRKDLEAHVNSSQSDHLLKLMVAFETSQKEFQNHCRELQELKMFKATTTAAMTRISQCLDQHLEKCLTTELSPLRSIRALLGPGTLILNSEHKEISLVVPNYSQFEKNKTATCTWESLPFYLGAGYKACLAFLPRTGKAKNFGAELRLLRGEFDDKLSWPCNLSFDISLSLKKEGEATDITSIFDKSGRAPFRLSVRGTMYNSVTRCCDTDSYHILWNTPELMDPLPPYPSAIRARYLHHDCLTVQLTWVESTLPTSLEHFLSKLTLKANVATGNPSSSRQWPRPVVSVFTSTSSTSPPNQQASGWGRYRRRS